ncbi:MAG: alpha/beta hydrolase [Acidimicrobiales bacterium]
MRLRSEIDRRAFSALLRLPRPARRRMAEPIRSLDGRVLDVDIALLESLSRRRGGSADSVEALRLAERELFAVAGAVPRRGVATHDRVIRGPGDDLAIRVYHPPRREGVAPGLVWFHQGGCVIGGLHTCHPWCTLVAERTGAVVVSVDYRLAPEHPFPAAVDDAMASYQWVADNADGLGLDRRRLAVGGASAGATLATVVGQQRRRLGQSQPALQVLAYPGTDGRAEGGSMVSCADCFPLSRALVELFSRAYLPDPTAVDDPRFSPAAGDLWGLAPAIVVTAGFDPLRDQGDAYAAALDRAGVEVVHRREDHLSHSFTSMGRLRACRRASERLADDIKRSLTG